jgi:hypothetical protein
LLNSVRAAKLASTLLGRPNLHDSTLIGETTAMIGLEGAILVPVLILGSAAILYYGLISVRSRQVERRDAEQ